MPISIDDALDTLIENADFEEAESVSRAKTFVTAAKRYLILAPQAQSDQGSSLTLSVDQIHSMLKRAQLYVRQQQTTTASNTRVRFLSAGEGFRR